MTDAGQKASKNGNLDHIIDASYKVALKRDITLKALAE